ncbi:hypothetical protein Peur_026555 [Populus x canadensis]
MAAHLMMSVAATSKQATRGEQVIIILTWRDYRLGPQRMDRMSYLNCALKSLLDKKKERRKEWNRYPKFKKGTMALLFGEKGTKFMSGVRYWWDRNLASRNRNQIVKMVVVDLYAFLFIDGERKKRSTTFQDSVVYDTRKTGRAHMCMPSRIRRDQEISDRAWEFSLLKA